MAQTLLGYFGRAVARQDGTSRWALLVKEERVVVGRQGEAVGEEQGVQQTASTSLSPEVVRLP